MEYVRLIRGNRKEVILPPNHVVMFANLNYAIYHSQEEKRYIIDGSNDIKLDTSVIYKIAISYKPTVNDLNSSTGVYYTKLLSSDGLEQLQTLKINNVTYLASRLSKYPFLLADDRLYYLTDSSIVRTVEYEYSMKLPIGAFYNTNAIYADFSNSGLLSLSQNLFSNCNLLTCINFVSLDYPNSTIENIYSNCFYGCSSLSSIIIPGSVKSIGDYTFNYCTKMQNITLGLLESIGDYVFSACSSLNDIYFTGSSLPETAGLYNPRLSFKQDGCLHINVGIEYSAVKNWIKDEAGFLGYVMWDTSIISNE